jgi:hypothetical protein
MTKLALAALSALLVCRVAMASEELITSASTSSGDPVPYVLNREPESPRYVFILFPGGAGAVDPHIEDGTLVYSAKSNFLLRARQFIVDEEFATVSANASPRKERIQAIIDDLARRFPGAEVYLVGTSNGTEATIALADYLSDRIAGEIHTSSLARIAAFDAKRYKNRHLVVHHKDDACKNTPFHAAEYSHQHYGNDFIAMEGGTSLGNACGPFAYHGYNGIERETVEAIKQWVKRGRQRDLSVP